MKNKQKQNIPNAGLSIEFRAGDINGHTDTIQESTDFDPASKKVDSLNFVGGGKKLPGSPPQKTVKRESIYKAALLAQLKNANLEEAARASESMDSQSEGTNSDDDGMDDAPKKSRFGPKH
jgi:hypothetical protein